LSVILLDCLSAVCMSACLPACLPVCISACLLVCLLAWSPAYLSACRSACLSACLPVCLSASLPACDEISPAVDLLKRQTCGQCIEPSPPTQHWRTWINIMAEAWRIPSNQPGPVEHESYPSNSSELSWILSKWSWCVWVIWFWWRYPVQKYREGFTVAWPICFKKCSEIGYQMIIDKYLFYFDTCNCNYPSNHFTLYVCYMLYVVCCMLYVACCMLHVACCIFSHYTFHSCIAWCICLLLDLVN